MDYKNTQILCCMIPTQWEQHYIVPDWQRDFVWKKSRQQELLRSLFLGRPIPAPFLWRNNEGQLEIVDGQQRLTTIKRFYEGKISLPDDEPIIHPHDATNTDIRGAYYKDLKGSLLSFANELSIPAIVITSAQKEEIAKLFIALQNADTLTTGEKLNGVVWSEMRDFVNDLYAVKDVYDLLQFCHSNSRYKHQTILAMLIHYEINGLLGNRNAELLDMYAINSKRKEFDKRRVLFNSMKSKLSFLKEAFSDFEQNFMASMHGVVGLTYTWLQLAYHAVDALDESYDIDGIRPQEFGSWFYDIIIQCKKNKRRREAEQELALTNLFYGVSNYSGEVNAVSALSTVVAWLVRDFDLKPSKQKDPKRIFTRAERLIIFYDSEGYCANADEDFDWCEHEITFSSFHADHVIPHSKGGATVLENAQALCPACNRYKSDKMPHEL